MILLFSKTENQCVTTYGLPCNSQTHCMMVEDLWLAGEDCITDEVICPSPTPTWTEEPSPTLEPTDLPTSTPTPTPTSTPIFVVATAVSTALPTTSPTLSPDPSEKRGVCYVPVAKRRKE